LHFCFHHLAFHGSDAVIRKVLEKQRTLLGGLDHKMEFLSYFGGVFEPLAFLLLLGGTIGGLILGATPGLSPTMAVALLIPFTFQLSPTQGLILLGAAYTSTVAGGAVSAILLKIPGAPANIATSLDGYEMAKQGHGARALHLSFLSSGVGGIVGVLLLIFLTPVLAQWALAFGPAHLFWLAILGVTVIGSLDSKSFVKGLLSGCIGLWLSMIGYDDIQGAQRFIFSNSLTGGINIIAALIGLFAIPQVIDMFSKGRNKASVTAVTVPKQSIAASFREITQNVRALSIGTVIGSIVGLIPGVGGQIAGLVAYDQSRKFSPDRDKYGTGHPEGVIAAEAANNAMVGPSLVPLLTLSIPGSPTAAVLLGGLLIHGIFPGSDLFESHPEVAWTFINSMLVGQVLMVIFGIYTAAWAARIARAPEPIMAAAVMVLAVFGSYSVQQSMGDVYIMLNLGIGMYFLEKFGFSAAPLVLGLILGPIAEANFIQGSLIADAQNGPVEYFMTGTLNIFLIALVLASIGYSFWSNVMQSDHRASSEATQ
jgi:putative tricarboxylic transport membrane protein